MPEWFALSQAANHRQGKPGVTMNRILIVDDEDNIVNALRRLLLSTPCSYGGKDYPLQVETFVSPLAALERAGHQAFDLVLSDYRMPGMDGVEFLKQFRGVQPDAARLILSGYADLNALVGAINEAQIFRFLSKPWSDFELVSAIAQALSYRNLILENQRLADEMRVQRGKLGKLELEMKRLEAMEPGITKVNWGPDGSVILDEEFRDLD
jgi:two-component system probable response regulator PhcQ